MPANLVDDGAVLVHPTKAFILRHIPLPERYMTTDVWSSPVYASATSVRTLLPDSAQYVEQLRGAATTLFGEMTFDLHITRAYTERGLDFHADHDEYGVGDVDNLIRMATCIHNATNQDRVLHFQRPDWSKHTEEFTLPIPAGRILVFGGKLITDYTHGIPPGPDAAEVRSVVTRFSLWRTVEGTNDDFDSDR